MSNQLPIVIGSHAAESGKKRVAAYCRVSSPSAEQLKSYQAQVDNYRKKFEKDDSVVFVGVYGDPGASGTRTANREGFMRMIDDCRRGEIDAIWTKSVSRFGRNTVDTLVYTRELRNLGSGRLKICASQVRSLESPPHTGECLSLVNRSGP